MFRWKNKLMENLNEQSPQADENNNENNNPSAENSESTLDNYSKSSNTSGNLVKKIIIIVIGVFIISGTAFGAWFGYQALYNTPEKILWEALNNFSLTKKAEIKGGFKIEVQSDDIKKLFLTTDSAYLDLNFDISYDKTALVPTNNSGNISLEMTDTGKLILETKRVDDEIYIKPILDIYDSRVKDFSGFLKPFEKWVHIDQEGIQNSINEFSPKEVDLDKIDNLINEDSEIEKNVLEIIKTNAPFNIKVINKNDKSLGVTTYHYQLIPVRENIDIVMEKIKEVYKNKKAGVDIPSYEKITDEQWEKIQKLEISIYINKKSKNIKKIAFYIEDEFEENKIKISGSLNVNEIANFSVEMPDSYTEIQEYIEEVFGTFIGTMMAEMGEDTLSAEEIDLLEIEGIDIPNMDIGTINPNDIDLDSMEILNEDLDNDGLTDNEELFIYNTDPENPDSDGDGYLDGAEVDNGYDPNGSGQL